MAGLTLDSDIKEERLAIQFYKRPIKNEFQSQLAGRPIFHDADCIRIVVPGDNLSEVDTFVTEEHKERFPKQWANYVNRMTAEDSFSGTPLEEWPLLTKSQCEELRGLKFHTVEAIANCSDLQLQRIGMAGGMNQHTFREKAKKFLEHFDAAAEIAEAKAKEDAANARIAELEAKIDALAKAQAQSEESEQQAPAAKRPAVKKVNLESPAFK
jgi:hypothetical protein